ncbi:hydroxyneurosporene dehydrogenase [Streptomyces sp. NPDC051642]|uniref:hydroxyneurosporene dehydrogenase n=1 Tax=unclassified Streptomyces TaxID=2593676 RepID=UPI0034173038
MADTPADYQRLGIAEDTIAPWEDGFRTDPGGPGTFEWWYFDAVLDDGSTLVINFMTKDFRVGKGVNQPVAPVVTFELDRPDGTHVERTSPAHGHDYAFGTDHCDVRIGTNTFAGDLHRYSIHLDVEGVRADVTLTGRTPSWRPASGHIDFGEGDARRTFAWLPSVPQGAVEATIAIDGATETRTGIGYHDHNWGDAAMMQLIHHWYWARGEVDGYTVIACHITAEKKFGHAEVPIFMLARDGKIIADDASLVRFTKADEHPDPVTGKPVADTTVYDWDASADGGEHYRVTFRREDTIVQDRMIESVKGPKRVLAQLARFDGAYHRFTGQIAVERIEVGTTAESSTAPGLWELMYFGKNV